MVKMEKKKRKKELRGATIFKSTIKLHAFYNIPINTIGLGEEVNRIL